MIDIVSYLRVGDNVIAIRAWDGDENEGICQVYDRLCRSISFYLTIELPGPVPPPIAPVEKTGLRSCWDENGNSIPCAGTGQDGELQRGIPWPNPRFIDNGDGSVTDRLTGLIWLKDADCFGAESWLMALNDTGNIGDGTCGLSDGSQKGDWRLPNIKELESLIDYGQHSFALPVGHPFDNVHSEDYWSSTDAIQNTPESTWYVRMSTGMEWSKSKTASFPSHVWPVRDRKVQAEKAQVEKTGQTSCWDQDGNPISCTKTGLDGDWQAGVAWPKPRLVDNGDGTVTDKLTGLIWLQDMNCFGEQDWTTALTLANNLAAGDCRLSDGSKPGDWRLPNMKELMSLTDCGRREPSLPSDYLSVFTNLPPYYDGYRAYWSSTSIPYHPSPFIKPPPKYYPGLAWQVYLDEHYISFAKKASGPWPDPTPPPADRGYVWAVRGVTSGPAPVEKTGQMDCWDEYNVPIPCAGTGQDGEWQAGLAWPNPRFKGNADGTVTDMLTGLIWLKNANCFGDLDPQTALQEANDLGDGHCGLTDNSKAGDWRLPNVKELLSLIDYGNSSLALSSEYSSVFDGLVALPLQSTVFWSSTMKIGQGLYYSVYLYHGLIDPPSEVGDLAKAWPVRGGVVADRNPAVIYPNDPGVRVSPGGQLDITWTNFSGSYVKIQLYKGGKYQAKITETQNDGVYEWLIPSSVEVGDDYSIQIISSADSSQRDSSDNPFTIFVPPPRVTYPNDAGISVNVGDRMNITWEDFSGSYVKIQLYRGAKYVTKITETPNSGSYSWTVPNLQAGADYLIKIISSSDSSQSAISDNPFTVMVPPPEVTYPSDPGIVVARGQTMAITWEKFTGSYVKIYLYKGTKNLSKIVETKNDGVFEWKVPTWPKSGNDYLIRICSSTVSSQCDVSDNFFAIQ